MTSLVTAKCQKETRSQLSIFFANLISNADSRYISQAQSAALRNAFNREGKRRGSGDETTGRPARGRGGRKRQRVVPGEGGEGAAAADLTCGTVVTGETANVNDDGAIQQGDGTWAPSLLHDGSEGVVTATAVPVDSSEFGGPAQSSGPTGAASTLDEGRTAATEELTAFDPPVAGTSAAAAAGGDDGGGSAGGGLGDMLCDESGGGLGVDGGLGDDGGGLDDGLGGL